MERFVCIHGHFYQPPRENPWLEAIERQESAGSYHDWNERITAECYAPNAAAPILDSSGRLSKVISNYERISFNFGPTLLSWMADQQPASYARVIASDRASAARFGGHGSAMAQVYNHIIMPLANSRDKRTQVAWGIRDFTTRYGRKPEGMWLAETAVDTESLELMAEYGIVFTVLEPHQAARWRRIRDDKGAAVSEPWHELNGAAIDPSTPYRVALPSGRSIAVFFYDGPVSQAVAFEGLLNRGEYLAGRLISGFNDARSWPQLMHIATDGETYGHHHRFGEMALAYALDYIEQNRLARITNYGQFLELVPTLHEVEIKEATAWSCSHGVERWRSDCGCASGAHGAWNQRWRTPVREAFDWLRDRIAEHFVEAFAPLLRDPWVARDGYIEVILDRSSESIERFMQTHARRTLTPAERVRVLQAMEMQRHALLMFTSCGWFFDDLAGIETIQCLQYAGRAVQLAEKLFGIVLEPELLRILEKAQSNVPTLGNGRQVWERHVVPARIELATMAAHYGISSMFGDDNPDARLYCYRAQRLDREEFEVGRTRMTIGRARVSSLITGESDELTYGIVHLGEHNLNAGVRPDPDGSILRALHEAGAAVIKSGELPEVVRLLDRLFSETYSLRALFKDELERILDLVLRSTLLHAETVYSQLYDEYAPLMNYLREMHMPLPAALRTAAEFALNSHLRRAIAEPRLQIEKILELLEDARANHLSLDMASLELTLRQHVECVTDLLDAQRGNISLLQRLEAIIGLVARLPFEVNLWKPRALFLEMARRDYIARLRVIQQAAQHTGQQTPAPEAPAEAPITATEPLTTPAARAMARSIALAEAQAVAHATPTLLLPGGPSAQESAEARQWLLAFAALGERLHFILKEGAMLSPARRS